MSRLTRRLADLATKRQAALVTYIMAGDPDRETSQTLLNGLASAGADIIELGMPFTDPMADGPVIEAAAQRSLAAGGSLRVTLDMVTAFRKLDPATPVVLMGYYNPVYAYGGARFCADAARAGVDGLILVDLPPEEVGELLPHCRAHDIDFIFLTTPTSDEARLPVVMREASGFVYYVSIAGITGTASANRAAIATAIERLRRHTALPICVGFGIRTPERAAEIAELADGVVVGSAIVEALNSGGVTAALALVKDLGAAVRGDPVWPAPP